MQKSIGEKIRKLRKINNWTQAELAQKVYLSRGAIGNYEKCHRNVSLDTLYELAKCFNVNVSYFTSDNISNSGNEIISVLEGNNYLDISRLTMEDKIKIVQMYISLMKKYKKE